MESLREQVKLQKLKLRSNSVIEVAFDKKELKELHELLLDPSTNLLAVHRVLIKRKVKLSYSSLRNYRQRLLMS